MRRNRVGAAAAGVLLAAMLIGFGGTVVGFVRAETARNSESRVAGFMEELLRGVGPSVAVGRDTELLRTLLDAASDTIEAGELRRTPMAEVRLRTTIGRTYTEMSSFDAAEPMLSEGLALARATWRGDHPLLAEALNALGEHWATRERWEEAEGLLRESLAMHRRVAPGDSRATATGLNNLAYVIQGRGRPEEAVQLYEQSLEMRMRLFSGDHGDVAESLNNLGYCLAAMGQFERAHGAYQASLDMRERLWKGDHPDIAVSLGNVAAALMSLHRPADALPRCRAAMEMLQRLTPKDHFYTAQAIGNVAYCLQELERPPEALPLYEESLRMWERLAGGADSERVAAALNNVGYCFAAMGRFEEALDRHQRALELRRRLKAGDPLARSLHNAGAMLVRLGRAAEAETLLGECLEISEHLWPEGAIGPGADRRHNTMSLMGEALGNLGRFAEAEPLLLKAWEHLNARAEHPKHRTLKRDHAARLAKCYEAWMKAAPGDGHEAKAVQWKAALAALAAAEAPSSPPDTGAQTSSGTAGPK